MYVTYTGAKVVFVDYDVTNWGLSPARLSNRPLLDWKAF